MNGKKLPIIKSAGVTMPGGVECQMPVVKGKVCDTIVDTLRDTGCSGVVVRKDLVRNNQYNGKHGSMLLINNTVRQVPIVKIHVDTSYLKGEVEAQCLPNAIYDLVIGNVEGAGAPDDPVLTWHEACAVTRRAQSKRSGELKFLKTLETSKGKLIGREDLARLQHHNPTLKKYRCKTNVKIKGDQKVAFEEKGGILYRLYRGPHVNKGKTLCQVMVLQPLRQQVMDIAHSSIVGGHWAVKKTTDKITSSFYWPGIPGDTTRFC